MTATYTHDGFTFMQRSLHKSGHAMPVLPWDRVKAGVMLVRRHLFGIVVIAVAVVFTGGVVAGFVLEGHPFPAVMFALIGGLGIAVGITYHSLGDPRK